MGGGEPVGGPWAQTDHQDNDIDKAAGIVMCHRWHPIMMKHLGVKWSDNNTDNENNATKGKVRLDLTRNGDN